MTTAREMIAKWFCNAEWGDSDVCDRAAESLTSYLRAAPEPVRLELAALLDPELIEALREMCDMAEENSQYKGEYLAEKHGDATEIAKARRFLPAQPSEDKT